MIRNLSILLFVMAARGAQFNDDMTFLKQRTEVVLLSDKAGKAQVAVTPAWQGRVMTSTDGGPAGPSYGWINREMISAGKFVPHMNPYGGEDRFWLGPEGGQFSIFFAKGAAFDFDHWQTPAPIDRDVYPVASAQRDRVTFRKRFEVTNYSGSVFQVGLERDIRLLETGDVWKRLGVEAKAGVSTVGYESSNRITNAGKAAWTEKTGMLSIWILGMYNATPDTTVVIPLREAGGQGGVTDDYFGKVPGERLVNDGKSLYFRADGKYRSKIGVSPGRATAVMGSYDAKTGVLTIVQFTLPEGAGARRYVNSQWKLQDKPFAGDAINSYSDDGKMGAFYELETSSAAADLRPGQTLEHVHRTIHLRGEAVALDAVAKAVLGVGLERIRTALTGR